MAGTSISAKIANTVMSGTYVCMESVAQLSIGQAVLRLVDRFLWIIEKSAQWSLPADDGTTANNNGGSFGPISLVRPLPWILFLPGLILLRAFRVGINVGAFVIGYPRIEARDMVQYLQKTRRRLRAIKTNGMKNMRQRMGYGVAKDCEKTVSDDDKWKSIQLIRSIQLTLSSLSCLDGSKLSPSPPPTRIEVRMNHESTPTPEETSTTESASSPLHIECKRRYSQVSSDEYESDDSEDETIQARLNRITPFDDSRDDDEFNPGESSNSTSNSSSLSTENSITASEIQEIQEEANLMMYHAFGGVAEIIKEEPEPERRGNEEERMDRKTKFVNPNNDYASENSEDNQEYQSPNKLSEDGETAFYSPVSSKSSSPDRTAPALEQRQQARGAYNNGQRRNACRNGGLNRNSKTQNSDKAGSSEKTTNGHAKEKSATGTNTHSTKAHKPHNRGRRTSNASRKKK